MFLSPGKTCKIRALTGASRARLASVPLVLVLGAVGGCIKNSHNEPETPPRPPANELRNPYFGDLHVHTARSLDAGLQGVITTPAQAYEYAKGGALEIKGGQVTVQLERPLDFAAVTDHAEYFGNFSLCNAETIDGQPNPIYNNDVDYQNINCPNLRAEPGTPENGIVFALTFALSWLPEGLARNAGYCFDPDLQALLGLEDDEDACFFASTHFWDEAQQAANDANNPGFFTAFKAYEWTGGALSANLHRNIIFAGDTVVERPYSYFEAPHRADIWAALASEGCNPNEGDCRALVIPHNSNLSQGRMFEPVMPNRIPLRDPVPMDEEYASQLADYERLVEIMQHKGQSECVTANNVLVDRLDPPELVNRLSTDELCDFEIVNWATLAGESFNGTGKPQDFVRDALKVGLSLIDTGGLRPGPGLNPFKFGIIASTDTHQGAPGLVEEAEHPGHGGGGALFEDDGDGNPNPDDPQDPGYDTPKGFTDSAEYGPGGLAVVWAEENTRESIFEAMKRKEVYGTSGTRPVVRFFGGFGLPENLCDDADLIRVAYDTGVPMGGDLAPAANASSKPRFMLSALMDQGDAGRTGTRLQRIQIIKGWVDARGEMQEAVYDIGGSSDTGASVDVNSCEPIAPGNGFESLCEVWQDEDFDPGQHAFYYGRVLENPVCRWHTYQCNAAGVTQSVCDEVAAGVPGVGPIPEGFQKCCTYKYPPDDAFAGLESQRAVELPKTQQERAWTTPIWYEAD